MIRKETEFLDTGSVNIPMLSTVLVEMEVMPGINNKHKVLGVARVRSCSLALGLNI